METRVKVWEFELFSKYRVLRYNLLTRFPTLSGWQTRLREEM